MVAVVAFVEFNGRFSSSFFFGFVTKERKRFIFSFFISFDEMISRWLRRGGHGNQTSNAVFISHFYFAMKLCENPQHIFLMIIKVETKAPKMKDLRVAIIFFFYFCGFSFDFFFSFFNCLFLVTWTKSTGKSQLEMVKWQAPVVWTSQN